VAAVEQSTDTTLRELLARAATMISGQVEVDVLRIAGEDFEAPSHRLTAHAVRAARRRGAEVIVMPAALLSRAAVSPTVTIIAIDDEGGPAEATADQAPPRPILL